jgi:hypothetical protein
VTWLYWARLVFLFLLLSVAGGLVYLATSRDA